MNPNSRVLSVAPCGHAPGITGAAKADPSAQEDLMPVRQCYPPPRMISKPVAAAPALLLAEAI
jgi:hypothetical protein